MPCFETVFSEIDDPRSSNVTHRLGDLLVMMIAASLCGASTATEFALFTKTRKDVLRNLIDYDQAPSHDTFSRLLRLLDHKQFTPLFTSFASAFGQAMEHRLEQDKKTSSPASRTVVAVDGKALRAAHEKGCGTYPPLTVSAFATQARLCLAMVAPKREENEVEAALAVVELLDLTDKIITADALHCHYRMAQTITDGRGHYMLALKGNRADWHRQAIQLFDATPPDDTAQTQEINHGRKEWRRAEIIAVDTPLMEGHKAFVRITSKRDEKSETQRFYMTSMNTSAGEALTIIRDHWRIENNLHWVLDVQMNEDKNRGRKDNAVANIASLKRIARNILQVTDNPKVPISHRIKKCAWDEDYLINAISHMR